MSRPTSAASNPFAALQQEILRESSAPAYADGWRSISEIAAELGICHDHAKAKARQWMREGRLDRWAGVVPNGAGRRVATVRYRRKTASYRKSGSLSA